MKVQYKTRNGQFGFEFDATTQTEIVEKLAELQEIFEDIDCNNGKEKSDRVNFVVRKVDGNSYYELHCVDETKPALRFAKRKLGAMKKEKGRLFPKGGWVKWDREKNAEVDLRTGKVVEKEKEKDE